MSLMNLSFILGTQGRGVKPTLKGLLLSLLSHRLKTIIKIIIIIYKLYLLSELPFVFLT